jgi:hypothetical protein
VDMIGTGILVAVALLLLTAAQLARRGVRGIFAGAGAATLAVGGVLYVLVELAA